MNKRSKLFAAILCTVLVFSILMTGCGQTPASASDGQGVKAEETAAPAQTQAAEQPAEKLPLIGANLQYDPNAPVNNNEKIEINFWYPEDVKTICQKYVAEYRTMHPNVTFIETNSPWDDYWTKLPIAISGGTGPDMFWMHNAYTDTMVPITEPMPESVFPLDVLKKDFRQVDLHLIDNKLYYIDTGLMSSIIMYNKAMWKEAGLEGKEFPKTWDELKTAAKAMTKTDASGNIIVSGFNFNGEVNFANIILAMNYQKGVFAFSKEGKASVFNNPVTIENMEYLKSWYTVDKIGDNKGVINREALGQGKTAMICDWTWIPSYIASTFPEVEIGYFPTPSFDGNPAAFDRNNGECSPCVNSKASSEAKAVSFDFIKYLLANDDFIREFSLLNGIFPSKYSLDNDAGINGSPIHQTLKATIDKTLWMGPLPGQIESSIGKYLQDDFLKNNVSAEKAVAKTDEIIAKDLANLSFTPVERRYAGAGQFKN